MLEARNCKFARTLITDSIIQKYTTCIGSKVA